MQVSQDLLVIQKPDTVSWDDISQVLRRAHQKNVEAGVYMPYPFLPPNEIKEKIDKKGGVMFVALMEGKPVGTGAVIFIKKNIWCHQGTIAYFCFGSVLPEYTGKGIYKALAQARENYALSKGVDTIFFDTHERNKKIIDLNKKRGYMMVDYAIRSDHNSVYMVKWLKKCPYSHLHCHLRFLWNKFFHKTKKIIKHCLLKK